MDFRVFSQNLPEKMQARCVRKDAEQALNGEQYVLRLCNIYGIVLLGLCKRDKNRKNCIYLLTDTLNCAIIHIKHIGDISEYWKRSIAL